MDGILLRTDICRPRVSPAVIFVFGGDTIRQSMFASCSVFPIFSTVVNIFEVVGIREKSVP